MLKSNLWICTKLLTTSQDVGLVSKFDTWINELQHCKRIFWTQKQQTGKAQSSIISWDWLLLNNLFAFKLNEPLVGWFSCEEIRNWICQMLPFFSFLSGLTWFIEPALLAPVLTHCRKRTLVVWGNGQLLQTLLYQSHAYQQWQQWWLLRPLIETFVRLWQYSSAQSWQLNMYSENTAPLIIEHVIP